MLTLIGLGASRDELSLGAWDALRASPGPRLARTRAHPALVWLESAEGGVTFDAAFDDLPDDAIVARVLDAARLGDVVYCQPGHPLLGDPAALPLRRSHPSRRHPPARLRPRRPALGLARRLRRAGRRHGPPARPGRLPLGPGADPPNAAPLSH